MIAFLQQKDPLPNPELASAEGLLAVSSDLTLARIVEAYNKGIFPWFGHGDPVMWWSPDPRMVLFPGEFKLSKSLAKIIKKQLFTVSFNTCFTQVIKACATISRYGQDDTWITAQMQEAYTQLHQDGLAQSVEVWQDNNLVGGLYGINLKDKGIFCGESMFSTVSNASKVGFYSLVQHLEEQNYKLIDCQMYTPHLASLGAREIAREEFLKYLQ